MSMSQLDEIRQLDPVKDHERIVYLSSCFDFPWDTTRALELALFRTFGVPSISRLLDATGEFGERAQKRYDDTDIIVSAMLENGYSSEYGKRALRRMNQIHGRFDIPNQDYLYVLSTFIYEPIRWNARYGWRRMIESEREAYFQFWRAVGQRMNIQDIPSSYEEFERFNVQFEREHFRFNETNQRVGAATRELFVSWFPALFGPLVRRAIYALLDEPLRAAFGFPKPTLIERNAGTLALQARAVALRLWPKRKTPRRRSDARRPSYPEGYTIEALGPRKVSETLK